jgi:ABC-type bacteriocin/lantibiotic exporter with double-glycine peptidase domain
MKARSVHGLNEPYELNTCFFCFFVSFVEPAASRLQRMVQEALENAQKGRTTVVIAHRLTTVMVCDGHYWTAESYMTMMTCQGSPPHPVNVTMRVYVIMTANRFSTMQHADHIVVIQKGNIVETGNHASLMAKEVHSIL